MAESIDAWWERRQRSKGAAVPYAVGTYREAWSTFPALVRQYHPEFNRGITLSQVPPGADVYLTWQCESGHVFVATPDEQRSRPGRVRRRSAWCPECSVGARGGPLSRPLPLDPRPVASRPATSAAPAPSSPSPARASAPPRWPAAPPTIRVVAAPTTPPVSRPTTEPAPHATTTSTSRAAAAHPAPLPRAPRRPRDGPHPPSAASPAPGGLEPRRRQKGEPFRSPHAPRTASAAEADLRRRLGARLDLDLEENNAVWVAQSFHSRQEVWPDIVIAELRVAIEYDTVGRFGLEHVGPREQSDRWKDRVLRQCGWEVVRIRTGRLQPLGPHDLVAASLTDTLVDRLLDTLAALRGPLLLAAYLR